MLMQIMTYVLIKVPKSGSIHQTNPLLKFEQNPTNGLIVKFCQPAS